MTLPFVPGGATRVPDVPHHPAFGPPSSPPPPPSFPPPPSAAFVPPGGAPERPAFVAPALQPAAAHPAQYGLPSIAPDLFATGSSPVERSPEPGPRKKSRVLRAAIGALIAVLVFAGLSVAGFRLFLMASGLIIVPDLTAAEAGHRCEAALTDEMNRNLEAALSADHRIKSNVLTGVEAGAPKEVAGGFDVAGTGRYSVTTAKKTKPGKMQLTCMVRRDGAGEIVTSVTAPAKKG